MNTTNLEQIFWENGIFIDKNRNPIEVKPIGIPIIFTSKDRDYPPCFNENEIKTIKNFLRSHTDKNYQEVNTYTIGGVYEAKNHTSKVAVHFYKKI